MRYIVERNQWWSCWSQTHNVIVRGQAKDSSLKAKAKDMINEAKAGVIQIHQ